MAKTATHHALARNLELLRLLPARGPGITAGVLTEKLREAGFPATKRSIERDLKVLEEHFPISCNDRSKPYGWRWLEGKAVDLPGVDYVEALSLVLVEDLLGQLAPVSLRRVLEPKFAQARQKLAASPGNRYSQWAGRVRYVAPSLPFLPPKVDPRVLEVVQEALADIRQLKVTYAGADEARVKDLELNPLAFVQRGPVQYLVATVSSFDDTRLFALHRMLSVRILDKPARPSGGFSLDEYLKAGGMQFGGGEHFRLRAEISTKLAVYLTETPLTEDQRIVSKGRDRHILTATLLDTWQLSFWILSQGAAITVLQPKDLRERIREGLSNALKQYNKPVYSRHRKDGSGSNEALAGVSAKPQRRGINLGEKVALNP